MSKNVLTIKTVQIAPFRTLMTALKDILLETNITFQPDGIRIINMDKSHTILAHLHLAAQNFEFYECKKERIIIGVNMFHLFKSSRSSAQLRQQCVGYYPINRVMDQKYHSFLAKRLPILATNTAQKTGEDPQKVEDHYFNFGPLQDYDQEYYRPFNKNME